MKTKAKQAKTKAKQAKRIREGDNVIAIAGNDRGKTGKVLSRVGKDRLIVQGISICKKHVRRSETNPQGGIIEIERPMQISNVMLCTDDGKPFKAKVRINKNGEREFYYKDGDKEILHRQVKKAK